MKIPAKKPKRAPKAAFKAPFLFSLLTINSPVNAPRKGPNIKPNGPRNKRPKINPILLPYTLPFPPPNFFAPKLGMKQSKLNIAKAIQKLKIKKVKSIYKNSIIKFANGGDRNNETTPEKEFCDKNDIETLFGIGGNNKSNSSSWILKKWKDNN